MPFWGGVASADLVAKTKGALPNAMKPADQRARTNSRPGLVVLPGIERERTPSLPKEYQPAVKRAWREFWRSPVAGAVDRAADMSALLEWAWALNEIAKIQSVISEQPTIDAQAGVVVNPLVSYWNKLIAIKNRAEIEFGMTPLSRSRLGLTIGQAKLTAQELNRRVQQPQREAPRAEVWEQEWDS